MIGTILNGSAIIIGGTIGLTVAKDLSAANQSRLKVLLSAFVVYTGLTTSWSGLNGTLAQMAKQAGIGLVSLVVGNICGKFMRVQSSLNLLGKYARERFSKAHPSDPNRTSDGFVTCSLLFCVGPMAILGALQDGLTGDFRTLAIKSVMDGLATLAFAKTFGWGVILSFIPVVAYQGTVTLVAQSAQGFLHHRGLLDSISVTGGLLVCCLALITLDVKKVRIGDYLPSLALAPLLAWLFN